MGAARDFLELINYKGLPLFNPLVGDSHVNNRQEYDNTGSGNCSKGKTLTEMINGYRADNDIRDEICNFNILKNKIRDMKDQQGNTMESYF
ncbi:hypothetical protein AZJ60_01875 [Streptococcus pneumoniae]|nr:hypothetical protein AZJ60_01875 [Streptococcus pneumoniae]